MQDEGFPFLAAGILMLPTVLCQLIPVTQGRNTAAFWSYLFSLMMNCGYGFLAAGEKYLEVAQYLLGIPVFCTIIPFSMCCCKESFQSNHLALREIFSKPNSRADFIRKMCGNRALPPYITVWCEAYHYETRVEHVTTTDSQGNKHHETRTHREKVVTYRARRALRYQTWEEKGNSIRMKETDVIHAVCTVHYKLDEYARQDLADLRRRMYRMALSRDYYADVGNTFETPGLYSSVVGSLQESKDCATNFYQGCWGRFFWIIFFIIGYQSAFESFWNKKGERMKLRLKKAISGQRKYRCDFGAEDGHAAQETFRFDNGPVVIDQSILTGFYAGPALNQELLMPYPDMVPMGAPVQQGPPMPNMQVQMQGPMPPNMQMQGPMPPNMQMQYNVQPNMQMQGPNMQMNFNVQGNMPPNMQMQGPNMQVQGNMPPNMQVQGNMQPNMQMNFNMQGPNMQMQGPNMQVQGNMPPNMQVQFQPNMPMNGQFSAEINMQGSNGQLPPPQ